jgi:hypothetical protein
MYVTKSYRKSTIKTGKTQVLDLTAQKQNQMMTEQAGKRKIYYSKNRIRTTNLVHGRRLRKQIVISRAEKMKDAARD